LGVAPFGIRLADVNLDLTTLPVDVGALHALVRDLAAQMTGERAELARTKAEIDKLRLPSACRRVFLYVHFANCYPENSQSTANCTNCSFEPERYHRGTLSSFNHFPQLLVLVGLPTAESGVARTHSTNREALALSRGPQRSTRAESPVSPEISPKEICQTVFG
jgi:hypothetical protein